MEERRYIEAYSAALLLGGFSVLIVFLADWLKHSYEKKKLVLSVDDGNP